MLVGRLTDGAGGEGLGAEALGDEALGDEATEGDGLIEGEGEGEGAQAASRVQSNAAANVFIIH